MIRLWATDTGKEILPSAGHRAEVRSLAFAPDGKSLASGGADSSVRLWDAATVRQLATLKGHIGAVRAVALSADGSLLASCCSSGAASSSRAARVVASPSNQKTDF